ncbi:arginyltransferase [Qipengyuania sp.]|uniref:arginyltransferase n=1 Tax=Qipengyuania sp. TaxID=2004515 RepID=UPI0035C7C841
MTAPIRFPRFFVTAPSPCPYLPGRSERKVFTELRGENADELNEALGRIGFRRSQTVAYRPSCLDCQACVSVRVVADEFKPSSSQKRTLKAHDDLVASECRPWATPEQYELLQRYLAARHPGGGMTQMEESDFADMVEHSPVSSYVIEYREPGVGSQPGKLVGACLTDFQGDGLSMIYSFYDPEAEARSGLGTYIILDHIRRAAEHGLPFVYLGYWVEGSDRMQYKVRFRPMERLARAGWERIGDDEHSRLIAAATKPRKGGIRPSMPGKDGARAEYRVIA